MLNRFKRFSVIQKILALFVGIIFSCCICGVLLPSPDDSAEQPVSNSLLQATQAPQEAEPDEPAATSEADTGEALGDPTIVATLVEASTEIPPSPTATPEEPPTQTPVPTATEQTVATIRVTASSANLRTGPNTTYDVAGVASANQVYEVVATNGDRSWYNIKLANGTFAWIGASVVEPVDADLVLQLDVASTIPAPPPTPVQQATPLPTAVPTTNVPTAVPTTNVPAPLPTNAPEPTEPLPAGCVDINHAGFDDLKRIIHIDDVRAAEMLLIRPFRSIDDMVRIKGIGPSRLADIKAEGIACIS